MGGKFIVHRLINRNSNVVGTQKLPNFKFAAPKCLAVSKLLTSRIFSGGVDVFAEEAVVSCWMFASSDRPHPLQLPGEKT